MLIILERPENHTDLISWLEEQLVGLDLNDLIISLSAILTDQLLEESLELVLNGKLSRVLAEGLEVLSPEELQALSTNPRALVELQEAICIDGGEYWQRVSMTSEHKNAVDLAFPAIETAPSQTKQPFQSAGTPSAPKSDQKPTDSRSSGMPFWIKGLMTLTAAVMAVAGFWFVNQPAPAQGWGWNREGVLANHLDSPTYLNHLAEAADDWFNKQPKTREDLSKRISQFRDGCDKLIHADHKPLAKADKEWLVERCKVWRTKLDGHLADLAAGKDVEEVQKATDETINKLIRAMRNRSTLLQA